MKGYIFIEKQNKRIALYGSLKAMFDIEEQLIGKKIKTFYNHIDLELEDYENKKCTIALRTVVRKQNSLFL